MDGFRSRAEGAPPAHARSLGTRGSALWIALASVVLATSLSPASTPRENVGVITVGPRSFRGDAARFDRRHGHWASDPSAYLVAPIALPDGVAIARLAAGITVGSPIRGVAECRLIRRSEKDGTVEVLAALQGGLTGYHRIETTKIDASTIDARHFRYYLVVVLESSTFEDPQLFHWIQIEYEAIV